MPWLLRLSGQSNINTSIMPGMRACPAMPYTHFDYMYFLSTYASIVGKKRVLQLIVVIWKNVSTEAF